MQDNESEVNVTPTPGVEAHTATYLASKKYPHLFTVLCSCGESSFGSCLRERAEAGHERHVSNPENGYYRNRETTARLYWQLLPGPLTTRAPRTTH